VKWYKEADVSKTRSAVTFSCSRLPGLPDHKDGKHYDSTEHR